MTNFNYKSQLRTKFLGVEHPNLNFPDTSKIQVRVSHTQCFIQAPFRGKIPPPQKKKVSGFPPNFFSC